MKAFVFPGQGAQFVGMGKDLYENNPVAKEMFEKANEILGFRITDLMFEGTDEDLRQTKVTQPAIFLHSVILAKTMGEEFDPSMVAGHSLGEFSALVAAGALSFEDGLRLVSARAQAMQKACEINPSTMAAVLALPDEKVEEICAEVPGTVVCANYNCPGQLVISGEVEATVLRLSTPLARSSLPPVPSAPSSSRWVAVSTLLAWSPHVPSSPRLSSAPSSTLPRYPYIRMWMPSPTPILPKSRLTWWLSSPLPCAGLRACRTWWPTVPTSLSNSARARCSRVS